MSSSDRPLPPKKDVALALLEGPSVFVHLDPRRPGVAVPPWLAKQPQLVLEIGLNMAIAIPDLVVGDEALSCTLSFNRSPFWCKIPWSAVFALVGRDGRAMVWPPDVPPEVAAQMQPERPRPTAVAPAAAPSAGGAPAGGAPRARAPRTKSPRPAPAPAAPKPGPRPVPTPSGAGAASGPSGATGKRKRELPPYLRVVK